MTGGSGCAAPRRRCPPASACFTSRSMMRPPGPVPCSPARETPLRGGKRLCPGEAMIFPPQRPDGCRHEAAAEATAEDAGGSGRSAAAGSAPAARLLKASHSLPAFRLRAMVASTGTWLPASWKIASSVPSAGDSTSKVALSVSTSTEDLAGLHSDRRRASSSRRWRMFRPTAPAWGRMTGIAIAISQ